MARAGLGRGWEILGVDKKTRSLALSVTIISKRAPRRRLIVTVTDKVRDETLVAPTLTLSLLP